MQARISLRPFHSPNKSTLSITPINEPSQTTSSHATYLPILDIGKIFRHLGHVDYLSTAETPTSKRYTGRLIVPLPTFCRHRLQRREWSRARTWVSENLPGTINRMSVLASKRPSQHLVQTLQRDEVQRALLRVLWGNNLSI
jgi:hypothetical protein